MQSELDGARVGDGYVRPLRGTLVEVLDLARGFLLTAQEPEGYWKAELETNVTMDAEDMLLRQFLGIREQKTTELSAAWIRSQQREDGTWANAFGGPPDLSTTVEAYVALRLAGDPMSAPHLSRAADFIRKRGGIAATRVFTRIWLALFGVVSWDDLPVLPPEMMFLPKSAPLNIYDFACWARQTIVPLTIVTHYRPQRSLGFDLDELHVGDARDASDTSEMSRTGRVFARVDKILHRYKRRPLAGLRERSLREAERWIVERQEADGSWGGIQPPWVYSLIALHLRGYPIDHPVIRAGLEGLETFAIVENGVRRLEACQSPVWDTALAVQALSDAALPADDASLRKAADWLLEREVRKQGDWAVRRPDLQPGAWSFEFANVNYPDVDDTAEVILALRCVTHEDPRMIESAVARGVRWTLGMQSKDGGWGAFDADNCRALCREIPFCDFGEVIDPPSADVTAHAVEMLCKEGLSAHPDTLAGVAWLLQAQEGDGSWFGRWGSNYVYGTGAVLLALSEAGLSAADENVRRAIRWLQAHQNDDGGWGEDVRSYDARKWRGVGESTASQTAWALLGLLAIGDSTDSSDAIERGVRYLIEHQRSDGSWDEKHFTGTGFPGYFYINYHLYRHVFPMMALGRYARAATAPSASPH